MYNDCVEFENKKIEYQKYVYIVMNKPKGYLSANFDKKHKTVFDIIDCKKSDLFVAGRLDIDTEGMLIITNDGDFAHSMLSPKNHIQKKYFVVAEGGEISNDDIEYFLNGAIIKNNDSDYKCMPAKIDIVENGYVSKSYITICEGKFHQVKKMFASINKNVTYLKRVKIGNLELDENMSAGEYRFLNEYELKLIGALGL